jgi:hypothetical protein
MSLRSKAFLVSLLATPLLITPVVAVAKPVCGDWSGYTPAGKKEKTIDGKKHTCDASTRTRSCCTYGAQTTCHNETETRYENCTAQAVKPGGLRPNLKVPPSVKQQ